MNEMVQMLHILDPNYTKETMNESYRIAQKEIGRELTINEMALGALATVISLVFSAGSEEFRTKNSKSLAKASCLSVMRALAFDIDESKSTTYFRKFLNISQKDLDKQVVDTIDNNVSDKYYYSSTARAILLVCDNFLKCINLDSWKHRLDVEIIKNNTNLLIDNINKNILEKCLSSGNSDLYDNYYELMVAYLTYHNETNDFKSLYFIS